MRLVYTESSGQLTQQLVEIACELVEGGKRVFYIAPNSLSFEKERAVLLQLAERASFDMTVTRFVQLPRYLMVADDEGPILDDMGLLLVFYRVLSQLDEGELPFYGRMKRDLSFLQQLLDLHKELQRAQLTMADVADVLSSQENVAELQRIFASFYEVLAVEHYPTSTPIHRLIESIHSGLLDGVLSRTAIVVEGFSRFSVEEEELIRALHEHGSEVVIATYASSKSYAQTYIEGNLYQSGVEFLRDLSEKFQVRPQYLTSIRVSDGLGKISQLLESRHDFSESGVQLSEQDANQIAIWQAMTVKEELEAVARSIRRLLSEGKRYKDILVLLGDMEVYGLQIRSIFETYGIPYYLGQAEEMSHHPLVHVVESLERISRKYRYHRKKDSYDFLGEDVINLLKSGLYGHLSQEDIDKFAQYVQFADVSGFAGDFVVNRREKYDLEFLNRMREQVITPLEELLTSGVRTGREWLSRLVAFFERVELAQNMKKQAESCDEAMLEREHQVWKTFCHLLEECGLLVGSEKIGLTDLLALIRTGLLSSHYRTVPATVDVVQVQFYNLIEPHSAKFVYAVGMSQSNFPKQAGTRSLLSDEERSLVNERLGDRALQEERREQFARNNLIFLSLVNAATEKLVLSAPFLLNETEEQVSVYLKELLEIGIKKEDITSTLSEPSTYDMGSYKGLLSRLVRAHQVDMGELSPEDKAFWGKMIEQVQKELERIGIVIPAISGECESQPLSRETLDILYPEGQILELSASSLTDFFSNEYGYFLHKVLGLEEQESIHPDARQHGEFLHRIFEKLLAKEKEPDFEQAFDRYLELAIEGTKKEQIYLQLYGSDVASQFSQDVLIEIARSTAQIFRMPQTSDDVQDGKLRQVKTLEEEWNFKTEILLGQADRLKVNGKIDRIDQLTVANRIGVVDYKSSEKQFKLSEVYNGLSPQLLTYLDALSQDKKYRKESLFGAVYLHMVDPVLDIKNAPKFLSAYSKQLVYQGLVMEPATKHLGTQYKSNEKVTETELDLLLAFQRHLYQTVAQKILSGHFDINPYTVDGKTVRGEQFKAITGFEANRHMGKARQLVTVEKNEKAAWLDKMREKVASDV